MRALRKSDLKSQMREEAKRRVRPATSNIGADRDYRQNVESGRRQLNEIGAEAGDPAAKKFKAELMYLLNNYLPSYDIRIEQLIDAWRRTGDPSYDPGIRVKLRQARKSYLDKSSAI